MEKSDVLVVPTTLLHECGYFQGFQPLDATSAQERYRPLFDVRNQHFMPRAEAEADPNFKQLIPYVLVVAPLEGIVTYWRGTAGGEDRLHGKRSIGFGGHINPEDTDVAGCDGDPYLAGLVREIQEELRLEPEPDLVAPAVLGLINDDSNEVGKVHLGVAHYLHLPHGCVVQAREPEILLLEYQWLDRCCINRSEYEPWSQLCLDELKSRLQMAVMAARDACSITG